MKKYKVKTPVDNFKGERLGFRFENGECICDDENAVREFESWGYYVEEIKEKKPTKKK